MRNDDITVYFSEVHYPASKSEVKASVQRYGAPKDVISRLEDLPEKTYRGGSDIFAALGIAGYETIEDRERRRAR